MNLARFQTSFDLVKAHLLGDAQDAETCIRAVCTLLSEKPELSEILAFDLAFARRRRRMLRRAAPPAIAVCGWEMGHNAAGRVRTLADIYAAAGFRQIEMIGPLFPKWGGTLWAPLRDGGHPTSLFDVPDEAAFPVVAARFVLDHPFDVVHLSKPRFPNILIGLFYKLFWDAAVFVDIDDDELGMMNVSSSKELAEHLSGEHGPARFAHIAGKEWTRVAVGLWNLFDGASTVNHGLQERFGGVLLPHARDAAAFAPSVERRRESRARFGIDESDVAVLFFGTARRHKGVLETARALAALDRQNVVFIVAGDFPDPALRDELTRIEGLRLRLLDGQPYDAIPDIVALGDICVLLQDDRSRFAQPQTPAKLTDALAMGLLVLAQPTQGVSEILKQGAAAPVTADTLAATLRRLLDAPSEADAVRRAGRRCFETMLSTAACRSAVHALLAAAPAPQSLSGARLLDDDDQRRVFDALGGWAMLRDPSEPTASASVNLHGPAAASASAGSMIVYTVLTGRYEQLKELPTRDPRARYLAFTDDPDLRSETWEIVHLDTLGLSPRRASRLPKLTPHRYLPEHDVSIYLDASLSLAEPDICGMAEEALRDADLCAYAHYERNCVYEEIEACLRLGKSDRAVSHELARRLRKEKFPEKWGLLENAFLIRRNTESMRRVNEIWAQDYFNGADRDQFYLMRALWLAQAPYAMFSDSRNFRTSPRLTFTRHLDRSGSAPEGPPATLPEALAFASLTAQTDAKRQLGGMLDALAGEPEPLADVARWDAIIASLVDLECRRDDDAQWGRERLAELLFAQETESHGWRAGQGVACISDQSAEARVVERLCATLRERGLDAQLVEDTPAPSTSRPNQAQRARRLVARALSERMALIATSDIDVAVLATIADAPTVFIAPADAALPPSPKIAFVARSVATEAILVENDASGRAFKSGFRGIDAKIVRCADGAARATEIAARAAARADMSCGTPETVIGAETAPDSAKPLVKWFFGSKKQSGWAYGINAGRLGARIGSCRHLVAEAEKDQSRHRDDAASPVPDVAIAFDVLIKRSGPFRKCEARCRILRAGGPNPFFVLSGGRSDLVREALSDVDAVIALSPSLRDALRALHPRVFFIPNGIDLDAWRPEARVARRSPRFTVGLSASLENAAQRRTKGLDIAERACALAGAELLVVGRGVRQLPHGALIPEFYSQIDALIHPVGAGKEASSNVIMEALALGVPVVTTRHAGFHGEALQDGLEALIAHRTAHDFAAALRALREDAELRCAIGAAGRRFAERHHSLDLISRKYERVIWSSLAAHDRGVSTSTADR